MTTRQGKGSHDVFIYPIPEKGFPIQNSELPEFTKVEIGSVEDEKNYNKEDLGSI